MEGNEQAQRTLDWMAREGGGEKLGGAVPVINENDALSDDESKVGTEHGYVIYELTIPTGD